MKKTLLGLCALIILSGCSTITMNKPGGIVHPDDDWRRQLQIQLAKNRVSSAWWNKEGSSTLTLYGYRDYFGGADPLRASNGWTKRASTAAALIDQVLTDRNVLGHQLSVGIKTKPDATTYTANEELTTQFWMLMGGHDPQEIQTLPLGKNEVLIVQITFRDQPS